MFRILLSKSLSSDAFEGGAHSKKAFRELQQQQQHDASARAVNEDDLVKAGGKGKRKKNLLRLVKV